MSYDINKSDRNDGNWVTGTCPYRAKPCGNPTCVDEAMRSGEIYREDNPASRASSECAIRNAIKKVKHCKEDGVACPLGGNLDDRLRLMITLRKRFKP